MTSAQRFDNYHNDQYKDRSRVENKLESNLTNFLWYHKWHFLTLIFTTMFALLTRKLNSDWGIAGSRENLWNEA